MAKVEKKVRNIGIPNVNPPEKECEDELCPFHGSLPVRGRIMEGIVTSTKMQRTITYQIDFLSLVKKYSRYERRRSKKHAHLPPCIEVSTGDMVKVVFGIIVPAAVFCFSLYVTNLLYRHFTKGMKR